jgi:glucose/arabinose dehydrogenase
MNRKLIWSALAISFVALALSACSGGTSSPSSPTEEALPFGLKTVPVANAARVSVLTFAPDGRMFVAEQLTGAIRIMNADGTMQEAPFAQLPVAIYIDLDWGLTGLALDPGFATNHFVYAFYTEPQGAPEQPVGRPKIVRFTDQNGVGVNEATITDDFPPTPIGHPGYNANGQIAFGPDGFLYASVGDYDDGKTFVQDLSTPVGKLLRIQKTDGSAAPGNPFINKPNADPRVFALGFREPFPFIFYPKNQLIYGTDNTPVTCEELNVIQAGKNYGWPDVGEFPFSSCDAGTQTQAIFRFAREGKQPADFLSFVEVSSLAYLPATKYPLVGEGLLVCQAERSKLNAEDKGSPGVLRRITLSGPAFDQVSANDVLIHSCKGGLAVGPDGTMYYTTDTEIKKFTTAQGSPTAPASPQR